MKQEWVNIKLKKRKILLKWRKLNSPYEVGKNGFRLSDLPQDKEGWIDGRLYRPFAYDLVLIQTQSRVKPGWWNGQAWEGLRIKDDDEIICWKIQ